MERKRRLQVAFKNFKIMTEEETREELRKTENRLKRWEESLQKNRELQREWQERHEEKLGPFLKKF